MGHVTVLAYSAVLAAVVLFYNVAASAQKTVDNDTDTEPPPRRGYSVPTPTGERLGYDRETPTGVRTGYIRETPSDDNTGSSGGTTTPQRRGYTYFYDLGTADGPDGEEP